MGFLDGGLEMERGVTVAKECQKQLFSEQGIRRFPVVPVQQFTVSASQGFLERRGSVSCAATTNRLAGVLVGQWYFAEDIPKRSKPRKQVFLPRTVARNTRISDPPLDAHSVCSRGREGHQAASIDYGLGALAKSWILVYGDRSAD